MIDKTKRAAPSSEELDRLANLLEESLVSTSDDEILAEAREDYGSVEQAIQDIDTVWERAQVATGKRRLRSAQNGLAQNTTGSSSDKGRIIKMPIAEARQLLARITKEGVPGVEVPITLAARNLEELPDEEVFSILADLQTLGAWRSDEEDDNR